MVKENIEIIYSDSEIVVINKPAGLSITKDRASDKDVLKILSAQYPQLLLIHRLDKPTSGIMIIARNTDTQREYCKLFENRKVEKLYLAFVMGYCGQGFGLIDSPLAQDRKDASKMKIDKRGKGAITEWKLIADFGMVSLVAAKPLTGRTHQIRVHLASIGMPLAIDELYGGKKPLMLSDFKNKYQLGKFAEERPLIERLTLHSYQLKFDSMGKTFVAKCEKHFLATLKMLAKHKSSNLTAESQELVDKIISGQEIPSKWPTEISEP